MRKLVPPLLAAALLLAGCGQQSNEGSSSNAAPPQVNGSVTLVNPAQKPSPQASLQLSIVDVSVQPNDTVASKTIAPAALPLQFALDYDPTRIVANDLYVLQVQMDDNGRRYITPLQHAVITRNAPVQVQVQLEPEPTPADKLLASFKAVQNRIGAMVRTQGTTVATGISRGWQAFADKGGVEFVRELVDYGDTGGFTSTDYAYQNGKPWVVVQQKMVHQGGRPESTDRAGWDTTTGQLVLKEHVEGGKTSDLSADAAQKLHDEAVAIYAQVGGRKK